jgi:NADPH:quinone reductase-like Zn-dependent oxidoreductase
LLEGRNCLSRSPAPARCAFAWRRRRLALRAGQTLGVTGAAGAVGGYAVELGVSEGLRVIAMARPEDEALVKRFGADTFIPGGDMAILRLYEAVPGGVAGLIDAAVLDAAALPAIRDGGKLATVRGFAGPSERGIAIEPVRVMTYVENHAALDRLGKLVAEGRFTLRVGQTYPPERTADAQRTLHAGGTRGRQVIAF